MPEKPQTCGECRFIGRHEMITICTHPKDSTVKGVFLETMVNYPSCDHAEFKDWRPDPLVKTSGLV